MKICSFTGVDDKLQVMVQECHHFHFGYPSIPKLPGISYACSSCVSFPLIVKFCFQAFFLNQSMK